MSYIDLISTANTWCQSSKILFCSGNQNYNCNIASWHMFHQNWIIWSLFIFICYVYQEDTPHSITPLIFSNKLTRLLGKGDVYLKLDNLQPSGSFKIRGIGQTCLQAKQSGATTIVGSSGGNAGKAMAYAAKKLNLKAVLFIPTSTPQMMIAKIKVSNRNSGTAIKRLE